MVTTNEQKVGAEHLARDAYVYIRRTSMTGCCWDSKER